MPKHPSEPRFPELPLDAPTSRNAGSEPSLGNLYAEVMFFPNHQQKLIKARLWQRWNEAGMDGVPSQSACVQLTGEKRVEKWWATNGFKEWFLNKDEHRERLDYLFALALDTAETILQDPEAQTSAKVNLIKVISELGNKMPNRYAVKEYADADINKMDEAQLRKYLSSKGLKYLSPAKSTDDGDKMSSGEVTDGNS